MISLSVAVNGLPGCLKVLDALAQSLDTTEILDEVEAMMLNRIRTRYLAKQDPDGKPWDPSAAGVKRQSGGYTIRNGKKYSGTGTLFETGTLFHSIQAYAIGSNERGIGTDVPYAEYAQYPREGSNRVYLGFGEEDFLIAERLVILRVKEALS